VTTVPAPSFLATRRGKFTLALLCTVAFLDLVDASIVNVALPSMRNDLHFSVQSLQWVPSGYLLTYGGFMLFGGRMADLLGRRRVLTAGTMLVGLASLVGGFAGSPGALIGARLAQGLGAALMLPAALSLLTTSFAEGPERNKALGAWGGMAALASAAGVLFGGLLTDGPGWRWVMFVNPIACVLVLTAIPRVLPSDSRRLASRGFDLFGTTLATGGTLLLVFALVKAPEQGWGSARTILELAGAGALLAAFVLNERLVANPLLPLSIFRVRGLAAADLTLLIAAAAMGAVFYFLTLYMQGVLGYSPIQAGSAYLPLCAGVGVAAGVTSGLMTRVGTRPLIVSGAVIAAAGVWMLSGVPVGGSYVGDLLPGLLVAAIGLGILFVSVTTAANAGVPAEQAGLAAALLNSSQQVGGALGLAIFSAIATAQTDHQLAVGHPAADALTSGFSHALFASAVFLFGAALLALRTRNAHGAQVASAPAEPRAGRRDKSLGIVHR
jgi:EmrB/QacA subfamily drug resistance transporter